MSTQEVLIQIVFFSCVGAAINCVNTNQNNNNVFADHSENPPPDGPGTLTVTKEFACESKGGTPNDGVCDYAETLSTYPQPGDYSFTVTGNNPNPSTFPGSSTGAPVAIGPGDYEISETLSDEFVLSAHSRTRC